LVYLFVNVKFTDTNTQTSRINYHIAFKSKKKERKEIPLKKFGAKSRKKNRNELTKSRFIYLFICASSTKSFSSKQLFNFLFISSQVSQNWKESFISSLFQGMIVFFLTEQHKQNERERSTCNQKKKSIKLLIENLRLLLL
jgi:hypothetical protein